MKKYLIFIIAGVLFGIGILRIMLHSAVRQQVLSSTSAPVLTTPVPTEIVGDPIKLAIPKLNVDVDIEKVGLDPENRMAVPTNPLNTGWYDLGSKPGETGSAVIDGHVDLPGGAPSIFYNLKKLLPGDEIIVTSVDKTRIFRVTSVEVFPDASFPIDKVFGATDEKRLNLITCNGVFDRQNKNYIDRLVVFSIIH